MSGIIQRMSPGLSFTTTHYTVNTPVYAGPLDLLLQLIERAELDITRLALAQVTDQYLEYIHQIPDTAPEEVSAFLVIAARLVQIKSEALLPRPPQREPGEEDPGDALARQLLLYKRFKELAENLAIREANRMHVYPRQAPAPKVEASINLDGVSVADLLAMAQWLLSQEKTVPELSTVVPMPRVTIREKIALIADFIRKHPQGGAFDQLLKNCTYRLEVVVTFLALLELVKRRMVQAQQDGLFGQIGFEPTDSWPGDAWSDDTIFEIEFGE